MPKLKFILLSIALLSLVAYAALGQSSRTAIPGTQPTATITELTTTTITTPGALAIGDATATDSVVIDSAGASSIVGATVLIGDAATTNVTVDSNAGITFAENGEALSNPANGTLRLTVDGVLTATFIGKDAAAEANTRFDTTTTGTVFLGSHDVSGVEVDGSDLTISKEETAATGAPNEMIADRTALNQLIGIPKINITHTGALPNGLTGVETANPLIANCNAIVNGAEADDATNFVTGAASYGYTWAADVAQLDGIDCVIAYPNVQAIVSLGFWFRTDTAIEATWIDVNLDDGGAPEATELMPAVTVVDEWQWIEMDFTDDCAASCDEIDGIEFLASAAGAGAGALDDIVMNIDQLALWRAADEVAIGDVQVGGVIDFSTGLLTPAAAGAQTDRAEWTDYFINYQTGADALVPIVDLSLTYGTTLEALN